MQVCMGVDKWRLASKPPRHVPYLRRWFCFSPHYPRFRGGLTYAAPLALHCGRMLGAGSMICGRLVLSNAVFFTHFGSGTSTAAEAATHKTLELGFSRGLLGSPFAFSRIADPVLTYLLFMAGPAMDREIRIRQAKVADVQEITALVNLAFRVERFFVDGDRIDTERIRALMEKGTFLLAEDAAALAGCVYVELRGERGYFGLLAVEPSRQRCGLGRRLALEAEQYARAGGCLVMDIMTVNVRTELPPIYHKMGYVETGTAPFPSEVRSKLPCHFVVMSKPLV